jgi:hypothetical protein
MNHRFLHVLNFPPSFVRKPDFSKDSFLGELSTELVRGMEVVLEGWTVEVRLTLGVKLRHPAESAMSKLLVSLAKASGGIA